MLVIQVCKSRRKIRFYEWKARISSFSGNVLFSYGPLNTLSDLAVMNTCFVCCLLFIIVTYLLLFTCCLLVCCQVGDEIVRVNGLILSESTHEEVVNVIKNKKSLTLTVKCKC